MLWEGFYHDFSTKKASASGGFAPWPPPRGSAPWTPEVTSPPLSIYPGAAPGYNSYIIVFIILFWCLDVKLRILLWILISEWNEGVWCRSFLYTCFSPTTRPKYRAIKKGEKVLFPGTIFHDIKIQRGVTQNWWPVYHAWPQPFKKHPKNGFYPWLKWHPEHITWVVFWHPKQGFLLVSDFIP